MGLTWRRLTEMRRTLCVFTAWNVAASAAMYGPLQVLEVTLRNAIHLRLGGTLRRGLVRPP